MQQIWERVGACGSEEGEEETSCNIRKYKESVFKESLHSTTNTL